jgi:YfiH family protein
MRPVTETFMRYLTVPPLAKIPGLVHGFGTREWRESDFSGDPRFKSFRLVLMNQVHSDIVHVLREAPATRLDGDALATAEPGLLLAVKTADCLPVLLADPEGKAVAAVHCGWRSTGKKILGRVVEIMAELRGSRPADLVAAFGPCIGAECYEVGEDVRAAFDGSGFPARVFRPLPGPGGQFLLDLRGANGWVLEQAGVRAENVVSVGGCTHCDPRLLSYRRDKGKDDRMFNFIGLTA